ncbi:rhodanese-like domain-containing protein [Phormidium yuhuli AB48]|uniref:Rhodanese-like domain-containing protein n=2 Tax=Phormidium TaxID=1198 RepID=A0ABY5AVA7_9CYAN|nr:rhodanese-like domain-containing protein [Phormidium yuhuli AB48]
MQLEAGEIRLIDVREPSEHAGENIAGSQLIPLSNFNPEDIPSDRPFVLHCQTGTRSAQAAQKLFAAGVERVSHLDGGLNAWKQAGYPTVVNKNAPISIMRQVQIVAGSLVLIGTLLGAFVAPGFLFLSGFVGAGLLFAGISNTCMMARLLAKLPYNQRF